jgi:hypothetical protein
VIADYSQADFEAEIDKYCDVYSEPSITCNMTNRQVLTEATVAVGGEPLMDSDADDESYSDDEKETTARPVERHGVLRASGVKAAEIQKTDPVVNGLFDARNFQE